MQFLPSTTLPCGITNLGNTCFLNSCVQLLNYTDELKKVPTDPVLNQSTKYANDRIVFQNWCELRDMMLSTSRGPITNPIITPGKFVTTIHDIARIKGRDIFTGWAQNDLPEFLLFMIECMHNSRKRPINVMIRGKKESNTDDLAFQCYLMLKDNYEQGDYSEISDIFYGIYVSRLYTPDGITLHSNKPEAYCILDLPIPRKTNRIGSTPISIYDCFDAFVEDELLSGWFNEKTSQNEPVRKNIVFWSFPNVLIITLKRYSPDGLYKNDALINFPLDELDLSKYVVGYKASSYKYQLFGVANHMGGISGGHYTAFVKNAGNWYCFNDANVSEMNPDQVVSKSAYCLFYRKK